LNAVVPILILIAASNSIEKDQQFQCFGCGLGGGFFLLTNLETSESGFES